MRCGAISIFHAFARVNNKISSAFQSLTSASFRCADISRGPTCRSIVLPNIYCSPALYLQQHLSMYNGTSICLQLVWQRNSHPPKKVLLFFLLGWQNSSVSCSFVVCFARLGLLVVEVIGRVCGNPICGPSNFQHHYVPSLFLSTLYSNCRYYSTRLWQTLTYPSPFQVRSTPIKFLLLLDSYTSQ
jgi:hypothetical protein